MGGLTFGYKKHTLVDRKNKLVVSTKFTPANAADIRQLDDLIDQANSNVKNIYGDKAYDLPSLTSTYLKWLGIELLAIRKKDTLKRLEKLEGRIRKIRSTSEGIIASIRAKVEHIFARLVNEFRLTKARSYDIRSNEFPYVM